MKMLRNFPVHVLVLAVCLCMAAPAGAELIQHLDATVEGSVVTDGAGAVIQWIDQSGSGNNAVAGMGSVLYPGTIAFPGGPVGLDFGLERTTLELLSSNASDQWLDQSAGTGGFTVIVVSHTSAVHTSWNDLIGNTSGVNNGWGFRYGSAGQYQVYLHGNTGGNSPENTIQAGDTTVWTHTYNAATGASELWTNQGDPRIGTKAAADFSNDSPVTMGSTSNGGRYFQGLVGEVMIFDSALSQAELDQLRGDLVYKWVTPLEEKLYPKVPSPDDGSVEVPLDGITLSWIPGMGSTGDDVYIGTDFDAVSTATPENDPAGVYMGRQSQTSFALAPLEYGQTYYWRVDSINGGIFSSPVWSFETIKYAYPMASEYITATASSTIEDVNVVNTINGAGLDANDLHNTNLGDMWLSEVQEEGTPVWLQCDLGALVKLNEMLVWNHNTLVEQLLGWGIKDASIEYTADGTTWLPLTEQPVTFEQAPGAEGYAANSAVAFNDLAVRSVRINALSNFEGIVPLNMYGLSEVQFLIVPVQAADPVPTNGQTAVSLDPTVSWSAGRGAVSHDLYVSDDPIAVADETIDPIAVGLTDTPYDLAGFDMNTVYYWKVNEVSDTEAWPGNVWSFTTQDYLVVEDFEDYNDYPPDEIFNTWIDGYGTTTNGATAGYPEPDFLAGEHYVETTVVHGGGQSMPLFYDNSMAPVSEAKRTYDEAQDWTQAGATSIVLYYQFGADSVGQELYVKINDVKVAAAAVAVTGDWNPITIDLTGAGIDPTQVSSMTIGIDGAGAKGIVYVDDIMLMN